MTKRIGIVLIALLMLVQPASAEVLQTLSGFAVSIDPKAQELRVLFEHPVTGENALKVFKIFPNTGFKNVKRLDQIQANDPVSVDYKEAANNELRAVYVEVVPLERVPFDEGQVGKYLNFLTR